MISKMQYLNSRIYACTLSKKQKKSYNANLIFFSSYPKYCSRLSIGLITEQLYLWDGMIAMRRPCMQMKRAMLIEAIFNLA